MYDCPEAHETIKWALDLCSRSGILCGTAAEFHSRLDIFHTGAIKTTGHNAEVVRQMIESYSSLAILWKLDKEWRYEQEVRNRKMWLSDPVEGVRAGDTDDEKDGGDGAGRGPQGSDSSSEPDSFDENKRNQDPHGGSQPPPPPPPPPPHFECTPSYNHREESPDWGSKEEDE